MKRASKINIKEIISEINSKQKESSIKKNKNNKPAPVTESIYNEKSSTINEPQQDFKMEAEIAKILKMKTTGKTKTRCPVCKVSRLDNETVNHILSKHSSLCKFECKTCRKGFKLSRSRQRHEKEFHENLTIYEF